MSAARRTKRIVIDNASMIYFMLGGLLVFWGGYWSVSAYKNSQLSGGLPFLCAGLIATGIALIGVGFSLGSVERSSESAEEELAANEKRTLTEEKSEVTTP